MDKIMSKHVNKVIYFLMFILSNVKQEQRDTRKQEMEGNDCLID